MVLQQNWNHTTDISSALINSQTPALLRDHPFQISKQIVRFYGKANDIRLNIILMKSKSLNKTMISMKVGHTKLIFNGDYPTIRLIRGCHKNLETQYDSVSCFDQCSNIIEIVSQELSSNIIIISIVQSFMEFDTFNFSRDTFHGSLAMLTVQFISCAVFFEAQLKHSINLPSLWNCSRWMHQHQL